MQNSDLTFEMIIFFKAVYKHQGACSASMRFSYSAEDGLLLAMAVYQSCCRGQLENLEKNPFEKRNQFEGFGKLLRQPGFEGPGFQKEERLPGMNLNCEHFSL